MLWNTNSIYHKRKFIENKINSYILIFVKFFIFSVYNFVSSILSKSLCIQHKILDTKSIHKKSIHPT